MKKILSILLFLVCLNSFSQQFIVLQKADRDTLVNQILPQFKDYMSFKHIGIDPIKTADSTYVLPSDLLDNTDFLPIKNYLNNNGFLDGIVIRNKSEIHFIEQKF